MLFYLTPTATLQVSYELIPLKNDFQPGQLCQILSRIPGPSRFGPTLSFHLTFMIIIFPPTPPLFSHAQLLTRVKCSLDSTHITHNLLNLVLTFPSRIYLN